MKIVLEEYIDIARQIKITHKQLLQLLEKTQEKMPPEIVHPLLKMEDYLFLFKERAEKQMLADCPQVINLQTEDYPDYSHIFYGGFKDIEKLSK
jgi:hypothetical protein